MSADLQIAHIGLFTVLALLSHGERKPLIWLSFSGAFYLFAQKFIWPYFMEWPDGVVIHLSKIAFDFFIIAMMVRVSWSLFVLLQSFVLFLIIGLNILAAVEFPFLRHVSIVYDLYPSISHALNIAQLTIGVGYGLHLIGMVDHLRHLFNSLVPMGTTHRSSIFEKKTHNTMKG